MNQELIQSLQKRIKELENEREEFTQGGIKILFSGKANAQQVVRRVKPRTLKEISELSIGSEEEKNKNLVIEGDNLWAMVTLYQYHGKVDLILTDPPYNTGKDFRYNDKWYEEPNDEGLGDYVREDDPSKHTKWMKFMLPRLQMMWKMLKPSGVLAICIDYRELFHLGKMLDEIFGEKNRLGIISWQKTFALKNDSKHLSNSTEYVLVYAKNEERAKTGKLERSEEQKNSYQNPDNDPKGDWAAHSSSAKTPVPSMVYGIQNPFTGKIVYPPLASHWRVGKSEFEKMLKEWGSEYEKREINDGNPPALLIKGIKNPKEITDVSYIDSVFINAKTKAEERLKQNPLPRLIFGKDGKGKPTIKRYFSDIQQGIIATTFWQDDEDYKITLEIGSIQWEHYKSGHNQGATSEAVARVGRENQLLDGIKPSKLFTKIVRLWCPPSGLVCDPFAGSGTTGEVVLQLNSDDRERERERERRFILIEQGRPEKGDDYCRTLLQKRLKAIITGKWADAKPHEPLGGGFKFVSLDKTIDEKTLIKMERKEIIEAIFASQITSFSLISQNSNFQYLIAKNKQNEGIYLIWNGKSQLTQDIYYQIVQEAKEANLSNDRYHIYARLCSFSTASIEFEQIPEKILQDLGAE
jgi:adenine-specific DNA-methyltransferase